MVGWVGGGVEFQVDGDGRWPVSKLPLTCGPNANKFLLAS